MLVISDSNPEKQYILEWFDDELDSILEVNLVTKERKFLNEIIFSAKKSENENIFSDKNSLNFLPINREAVEILENFPDTTKVLIGGDFLKEFEIFANFCDFHFSEIY